MRKWRVCSDAGMMFGVRSEGRGCLQHLLETEILEDSLGDEQVQLGVEAPPEVELHQHVAASLTVSTLEKVLPRLRVHLQLPEAVGNVLSKRGVRCDERIYCYQTWWRRG